jgi:hypothetical protein
MVTGADSRRVSSCDSGPRTGLARWHGPVTAAEIVAVGAITR